MKFMPSERACMLIEPRNVPGFNAHFAFKFLLCNSRSSKDKTKCQRAKRWSTLAKPFYNLILTQSASVARIICYSVALSILLITRFYVFFASKKTNLVHQCVKGNNTRNTPPPECANYKVLIKTTTIIKYNYSDVNVLNVVISVIGTTQSLYSD